MAPGGKRQIDCSQQLEYGANYRSQLKSAKTRFVKCNVDCLRQRLAGPRGPGKAARGRMRRPRSIALRRAPPVEQGLPSCNAHGTRLDVEGCIWHTAWCCLALRAASRIRPRDGSPRTRRASAFWGTHACRRYASFDGAAEKRAPVSRSPLCIHGGICGARTRDL